jgi:hypothetical protein
MLSLFHKLETSKKTRKLQQLPLLKKEVCICLIDVAPGLCCITLLKRLCKSHLHVM